MEALGRVWGRGRGREGGAALWGSGRGGGRRNETMIITVKRGAKEMFIMCVYVSVCMYKCPCFHMHNQHAHICMCTSINEYTALICSQA